MTIYFAGGEDLDFTIIGGYLVLANSSTTNRTAYSRCSIGAAQGSLNSPSNTDPPAFRLTTPVFTSTSSFWVHGQMSNLSNNSGTNNATLMRVLDSNGYARIVVRSTATSGQVAISTRNTAGTFTVLVTSAAGAIPATSAPQAIDLFVNYAAAGQVTLYLNGVAIADTGTGVNVTTNSVTSLCQADFSSMYSSNGTSTANGWSEIIVQDTTTIGMALQTIPPVAAGNTQSFTPNTVADVNPVTINDANFVSSTTANALSEWTVATTLPSGSWTIAAVVQSARVSAASSGGPQHFEWLVRTSDGSDHVTGSVAPVIGNFANYQNIWTTNPHTGAAWNAGELINAGIESLT